MQSTVAEAEYRAVLENEYSVPVWGGECTLSPEVLKSECEKIEALSFSAGESRMLLKARLVSFVLDRAQIAVAPGDVFAGRINSANIIYNIRDKWINQVRTAKIKDILVENSAAQRGLCYTGNADFGHISPDWEAVMTLGIPGLLDRVRKELDNGRALSDSRRNFYSACVTVYEAAIRYALRLAAQARKNAALDKGLYEVASCLENIAKRAPESLREAMQLTFLFYEIQQNVEHENLRSLGGLDRLYYRFYQSDISKGGKEEEARQLLRRFFLRFAAMKVAANIPFYLGGRLSDGSGAVNPLSYMIIEEYSRLRTNDPKIHVRCYPGMPKDFLLAILSSIRSGINSFVFMNDEVVEAALRGIGESAQDARNYTVIGCYEPSALGKEAPCTCNGRINLAKAVLLVLTGGLDEYNGKQIMVLPKDLSVYKSFDEFFGAVTKVLKHFADSAMNIISAYENYYPEMSQAPFLSATFSDCIAKGADIYEGGAKYNNSSINAFGIASAADALVAIKKIVYEEKTTTLDELARILSRNWEGEEKLRLTIRSKYPKYGSGNEETDNIAKELVLFVSSCINGKPNGRGGVFRCGFFSIDWIYPFGERTCATADGRLAGEPLSKNMGAETAMDREGVTALINSVTRIDYTKTPNGTVLDLTLHPTAVAGEGGLGAMLTLLNTYLIKGGFALQINVLDAGILREAQKNPEEYATLQIRLCGWNVYFNELTKEEQDDFIRRAEHAET